MPPRGPAYILKRRKKRFIEGSGETVAPLSASGATYPNGEPVPDASEAGEPVQAYVNEGEGSEPIRAGRADAQQPVTVEVAAEDAQRLGLTTDTELAWRGHKLYVNSTRDLRAAGIITQLFCTKRGEV